MANVVVNWLLAAWITGWIFLVLAVTWGYEP